MIRDDRIWVCPKMVYLQVTGRFPVNNTPIGWLVGITMDMDPYIGSESLILEPISRPITPAAQRAVQFGSCHWDMFGDFRYGHRLGANDLPFISFMFLISLINHMAQSPCVADQDSGDQC